MSKIPLIRMESHSILNVFIPLFDSSSRTCIRNPVTFRARYLRNVPHSGSDWDQPSRPWARRQIHGIHFLTPCMLSGNASDCHRLYPAHYIQRVSAYATRKTDNEGTWPHCAGSRKSWLILPSLSHGESSCFALLVLTALVNAKSIA